LGHLLIIDPDMTRIDLFKAANQVERRRFPAARRPKQRNKLPIGHMQREVVDCEMPIKTFADAL